METIQKFTSREREVFFLDGRGGRPSSASDNGSGNGGGRKKVWTLHAGGDFEIGR